MDQLKERRRYNCKKKISFSVSYQEPHISDIYYQWNYSWIKYYLFIKFNI